MKLFPRISIKVNATLIFIFSLASFAIGLYQLLRETPKYSLSTIGIILLFMAVLTSIGLLIKRQGRGHSGMCGRIV